LLLLLILAWDADRSARPWWAGIWLGIATAIKLFPGFVVLYFLFRKQWRTVAATALAFAGLTAFILLILGPESYRSYVENVMPKLAVYRNSWINFSLAGFWHRLFDGGGGGTAFWHDSFKAPRCGTIPIWHSPRFAALAVAASDALVVALLARVLLPAKTRPDSDHAFGLTLTAMLLISPVTWDHYPVLMLLPLATLWLRLPTTGPRRWLFRLALTIIWISPVIYWRLLAPDLLFDWMTQTATPLQSLTVLSLPFYALVALYGLGLTSMQAVAPESGAPVERTENQVAPAF
jgi:hypothetical protein